MTVRLRSHHLMLAVVGGVVAIGLTAGGAHHFHLFQRGTSTPLPLDETLKNYQDTATTAPSSSTTAPSATSSTPTAPSTSPIASPPASSMPAPSTSVVTAAAVLPADGVYVYTTTGRDAVDALTGDHHDYPATSTITVTPSACGVNQRWDILRERWESWQRCASAAGVLEISRTNFDQFFGQSQTDVSTCTGAARPAAAAPGTTWSATCVTGSRTDRYDGVVVGLESISVGGATVPTVHVVVTITDSTTTDRQTIDTWFQQGTDLLIAQKGSSATTNATQIGVVHYTETYEIHLTSLTPLT